ncbi:MAG: DUF2339 domain-containing protein [Ignavibacteria bacterium]|nr:DUF2339 domain-containing protein [Ignavibacteria bacterium]
MVELFILICLVLSIIALVTSSNSNAKLSYKLLVIEKELAKLRDQIRTLGDRTSTEKVTSILETKSQTSTSTTPTDAFQTAESTSPLQPDDLHALDKTELNDVTDGGEHQIPLSIQPESTPSTAGKPHQPFSQKQEYVPPKPRSRGELEALIGGKLLNRIGAIAMIIAVGFFLKYAFDNNWINEWTRVTMGAAFGVGMLFLAGYFHRKELTVFSQGIVGVGISSLYLSVYAAYNFYQLMPQLPAFVLMMAVTVIAFLQAMKYNSLAAAVMATVGGFLTPILLPTPQPNEVGLFTYLALLDVGIMILVVAKDRWVLIEHLARFATYLLYFSWFQEYYQPSDLAPTLFHLTLFWALFFAGEFYKLYSQKDTHRILMTLGSVMNALAFSLG